MKYLTPAIARNRVEDLTDKLERGEGLKTAVACNSNTWILTSQFSWLRKNLKVLDINIC